MYKNLRTLIFLRIVKTITLLLTVFLCQVSAHSIGQQVSLQKDRINYKQFFTAVQKQTGYRVVYNSALLENTSPFRVNLKNEALPAALTQVLEPQGITFVLEGKEIILTKLPQRPSIEKVQHSITGSVTDSVGAPLVGATIRVKGTELITRTDSQGRFTVTSDRSTVTLLISMVGFQLREVSASTAGNNRYVLQQFVTLMDETVIIGYGTRKRSLLTGSVGRVSELKAEENMVSNPISALQGRIAGLQVQNTSSSPGSIPNFVVRGVQTTQGAIGGTGANPLIVVDGLVIDAIGTPMSPTSTNANYSLANLNPQDIASVEVLKDAASSAIYGARGAQGVILITTKQGQLNSKPTIALNSYYGVTKTEFGYRPLNSGGYQSMFNEARQYRISDIERQLLAGNLTPGQIANLNTEKGQLNGQINSLQMGDGDTNWIEQLAPNHAGTYNLQASISGGTAKSGYYVSFGKFGEDNSIGKGRFGRNSGKLSLIQQLYPWLDLQANIQISNSVSNNIYSDMYGALQARPDTPLEIKTNSDGSYGYWFGAQPHPFASRDGYRPKASTWNYVGNFSAKAKLTENLSFRTSLAASQSQIEDVEFFTPFSYEGQFSAGHYKSVQNKGIRYTFNNLLTYNVNYDLLQGDVVLGQEFMDNSYGTRGSVLEGFPVSESLWAPGNASRFNNNYTYLNRDYQENSSSYFLRTNLSWNGRYLLSASLRRDGSSKLKNFRYAWFPAVSAGYILSKESFVQSQPWIDFLKVRGSYGITGNIRPLGLFDVSSLAGIQTYLNQPALQLNTTLGNPDLQWERTKQYDIGLDGTFWKDRIQLTAEFYVKQTDDLITSIQIPMSSGGFMSQRANLGGMRNRGLDLSLSVGNSSAQQGPWKWRVGTDLNINRNKVTELRDNRIAYGGYAAGGPMGFIQVGRPVGLLQLYNAIGIDQQTGDAIYEDVNQDGLINQEDMVYISTAQPKISGGFHGSLSYKKLSLSSLFVFSAGSKIYNFSEQEARQYGFDDYTGVMVNKPEWVLDRWTAPGSDSRYPRAVVGPHGAGMTTDWNTRVSTLYLYNASYVRLKNLTLAYDLTSTKLKNAGIGSCRVYVAGQNLFIIKDKNLNSNDPEQAMGSGWQQAIAPMPRVYSLGFDITF
ncbi:SusC/RagA family TonB-linked outer membrane protein [Sphingobacterium psychroaquaticum]|nr:SusC/RagA family TonB-linked outer membrane protein [Sphingobacterium psychroaquaticum]